MFERKCFVTTLPRYRDISLQPLGPIPLPVRLIDIASAILEVSTWKELVDRRNRLQLSPRLLDTYFLTLLHTCNHIESACVSSQDAFGIRVIWLILIENYCAQGDLEPNLKDREYQTCCNITLSRGLSNEVFRGPSPYFILEVQIASHASTTSKPQYEQSGSNYA